MYTLINEKINVDAKLGVSTVIPLKFTWQDKEIKIRTVDFKYKEKVGDQELVYFCVSTRSESYKIVLNNKTLAWKLIEIYTTNVKSRASYINEKANTTYRL